MSVTTGKETKLYLSLDNGVTFKVIGPVHTKDINVNAPTADVTTQSNSGNYSEFKHTGYSQVTMNLSGIVDNTTGTDIVSGFDLMTYKQLTAIANGPLSCRKVYLRRGDSADLFEGEFLITEFSRSGSQSDVQEFSISLQSRSEIAYINGEYNDFMIFMENTLPNLWQF